MKTCPAPLVSPAADHRSCARRGCHLYNRPMRTNVHIITGAIVILLAAGGGQAMQTGAAEVQRLGRDILKELIETDTTHSIGQHRRWPPSGWPPGFSRPAFRSADVHGRRRRRPATGTWSRAIAATPAARSRSCSSLTSTWSKPGARTGRWIRSSSPRRTATSTAAARSTSKAARPRWSPRSSACASSGFVPDRDLILALTADEEGGPNNGVEWLLANRRDLDRRGVLHQRRYRRRGAARRQGHCVRSAGGREGVRVVHVDGEESRRPQLAADRRTTRSIVSRPA